MSKAQTSVRLTVGEWGWSSTGEDADEPALDIEGHEIRVGGVDAAYLRKLALDLMKLAALVASQP
jgi:hypothetical protein